MGKEELKRDWLTNNALLAFVGALLMGERWQASPGTVKIFFTLTVPDYSEYVVLAIIAALFLLSIFLAVAVFFERVRRYAFRLRSFYLMVLNAFVWLAFTLSWLSLVPDLPWDQWWAPVLVLGGFLFSFVFIPLRLVLFRKTPVTG